jgi:hypothetical protein
MHSLISRLLDIVPTVLANFLGVFQCIWIMLLWNQFGGIIG